MKHKLISIALITILLCMFLGNIIACAPTTKYDLTIASTEGGNVTTPGEGTFSYNASKVVNLVATPDASYQFVNWTGDVDTIANVNAATTTITMNGDYTITANFALNMTFIDDVPDTNQPPTQTLPTTKNLTSSSCAPMAMVNIMYYWDVVMGHANAQDITDDYPLSAANTTAEYLGYFMDTNNNGSLARVNAGQLGTLDVDMGPGTVEFVRWDAAHNFTTPPPNLPFGKLGYTWTVTTNCTADYNLSIDFYTAEIDAGRPLVVSFRYWNPDYNTGISYYDPETGETIDVCAWGNETSGSHYPNPEEYWSPDIGHAVTGVGYIFAWAPDGSGPYFFVIVHDNWATTPKNIAIQWKNWKCLFAVNPSS